MERCESYICLGFSQSNWTEQKPTVDPGKGKVGSRFTLERNCFLHLCCVIHWWWIDQLPVVLRVVQKRVKNRNSAPCPFTFYLHLHLRCHRVGKDFLESSALVWGPCSDRSFSPISSISFETAFFEWFRRFDWAVLALLWSLEFCLAHSVALQMWSSNALNVYE